MQKVGFAKRLAMDVGLALMRLSESATRVRGTGHAITVGRAVGAALWRLAGVFLQKRLRRCYANVEVVLPDVPPRERKRIVRRAVIETASLWPELVSYAYFGARRVLGNFRVEGRENLLRALAKGRGVIAPGIHLGNFALIGVWMTQAGQEFYFVARSPHDPRVARRFAHVRRLLGIGWIDDQPRRACLRSVLEALGRGAVVFMPLDMRSRDAGVDVEYFGRPFHSFTGPVSIALKAGTPVVPMHIVREAGIRHRLVVGPEMELVRSGDRQVDVRDNLQALMHVFEGWVKRHPDQYWWFNRRWDGV